MHFCTYSVYAKWFAACIYSTGCVFILHRLGGRTDPNIFHLCRLGWKRPHQGKHEDFSYIPLQALCSCCWASFTYTFKILQRILTYRLFIASISILPSKPGYFRPFCRFCNKDAGIPFPYLAAKYLYRGSCSWYHALIRHYVKNGYLWGDRWWLLPVVPLGVQEWGHTAIVLSVIGIVYASLIALHSKECKKILVAYSSIAHVGLISAGIFALNQQGMQGVNGPDVKSRDQCSRLVFVLDIISSRLKLIR